MPVSLDAIRQMIKNRQYEDARSALEAYLRANPKSAEGWYLLSMAEETTPKRLTAVRKAAKLAPKNARVQARLAELQAAPKARSGRLILVLLLLIALVIAAGVWIPRIRQSQNSPQATAQAAQPTSVAETPTDAPEQTESAAPEVVTTEEIIATPDIPATPQPTQSPTLKSTVAVKPSLQPTTPAPTATTKHRPAAWRGVERSAGSRYRPDVDRRCHPRR
jgi:cytoskeletal protein RodZ